MNVIYNIYKKCINKNVLDEQKFMQILNREGNRLFIIDNMGFYVLNKNRILLLCVDPSYQNQGIGSKLLNDAEKRIKDERYSRSVLGIANNSSFLKGIPFEKNEFEFFDKRGYEDTNIIEDKLFDTKDNFNIDNQVSVEYLNNKEIDYFKSYVELYDYSLLNYIDFYENVVVSKKGNDYVGFCQLDTVNYQEFNKNIGIINNMFVFPEYRKHNESLNILEFAKNEFAKRGIEQYEVIKYNETMFSKLVNGKTYVKFYMGSKDLENV